MICRRLATEGVLLRAVGPDSKIVNELISRPAYSPDDSSVIFTPQRSALSGDRMEVSNGQPGSSHEQRGAEAIMLQRLSESLGVQLLPRKLKLASGVRVELDGADEGLTVLVECWAHQGPAKVAQKSKMVTDAVKLHWVAQTLALAPERLILCVSDPAAIKHLRGTSWQGAAIAALGITLEVVELPQGLVTSIVAAQKRQYR